MQKHFRLYFLSFILSGAAVSAVVSGCTTTSTSQSTSSGMSDAAITIKVKEAFAKESTLKGSDVTVETSANVVLLSGFVKTGDQKVKAEEIAAGVTGVKSVTNAISIKQQFQG